MESFYRSLFQMSCRLRNIIPGLCLLLALPFAGRSQGCSTMGQTPETAFPVCGTSVFTQNTVPICGDRNIPVPCNDGAQYQDKNPFWYTFTCFAAGSLGFVITPNDLGDDYDWQLFDITGHQPADVYTDPSLFVTGNWSGESGKTGASADGHVNISCAGPGKPLFSAMPVLKKDHQYLLLVSHFTDSQSGYQLSFADGTASITDPKDPHLDSTTTSCDATQITVWLNKDMKCSSLAADGSEFVLSPALARIVSAKGNNCQSGFDLNAVTLTLDKALPVGDYTIAMKEGKDKNTLLDNCEREIPPTDEVSFSIEPRQPTPMDSLTKVGCAPDQLELVFKSPIRCSSIAADGSDFSITGPSPVAIAGAAGTDCNNGETQKIVLKLKSPVVHGGNYQVTLGNGSDGNTLIDACGQPTPAGSALSFSASDTVSADFDFNIHYSCTDYTISLLHPGGNGIDSWSWDFGNGMTSTEQNPVLRDSSFASQPVRLTVSNGVCSDQATATIVPDDDYQLKADFEAPDILCPKDEAAFKDNSLGNITSYHWDFGNGSSSLLRTPPDQHYPMVDQETLVPVVLTVENNLGCVDTAVRRIRLLDNCYIAVPSAFTPNGDGMNDYLYPLNAYKADNLDFKVYNRYGQLVFETRDWTQKWDGRVNGELQATGTYVWMLQYINRDTGKKVFQKGATVLIR